MRAAMHSHQDHQIMLDFRRRLEALEVPLHRRVVYGSRARGDARPDSDDDVLLVLENDNSQSRKSIHHLATEFGLEYDLSIFPVVMTRAQFEKEHVRYNLFMMNADRDGVAI